jgi:argininosuccinate lyase
MVNNKNRLRSRFKKKIEKPVGKFLSSILVDKRLYKYDIRGSIAHIRMLARQEIVSNEDADTIVSGLVSIEKEIDKGEFRFKDELEDIHMNIEDRLFEKIGDMAGKLHTGRSRNDQITLDMRLFLIDSCREIIKGLKGFQSVLIELAGKNVDIIMPGYTHLQKAQPILLSHHLLSYFEMLQRDVQRFQDGLKRIDVLPLGSGALAGVTYPIDRDFVAKELGFSKISANSVDAVSDRDFIIECAAAAAIVMMHLSRFAEEIVLWSSGEFGFLEIDDAYATTSSMMPQKKNPDVAELIRGKTGRVYGNLMGLLTIMKGLPLAYNRDMQEDKECLFDSIDTISICVEIFSGMMRSVRYNKQRMGVASAENYSLATDIADYLVKKGLPFREAHNIVGKLVKNALQKGKRFSDLHLADYHKVSSLFDQDILGITAETSVNARNTYGGTAKKQVILALKRAKKLLDKEYAK